MVIKALIFDVGGVVLNEFGGLARESLARKYGYDGNKSWEYMKKNLVGSYKGELDAEDFFQGMIFELGLEGVSASDLVNDWVAAREETSSFNEGVVGVIKKLKGNYLLGVLSDSTKLNEVVSVRKKSYEDFDFKILSCDVGMVKPDKEIYELLVERLKENGVVSEETVFIDDKEENLVPARELGIETILFEDSEQMIRDLREIGVSI